MSSDKRKIIKDLPFSILLAAFFSAIFVDASVDVSVWIHCALAEETGCDPANENYRNAGYTGLAIGSMLAILTVFIAVRINGKSRNEAIGLVMTVLATGLISLFKIAESTERHHPVFENMDVALGVYLAVFALIVLPLFIHGKSTITVLGCIACAILIGGFFSLVFFDWLAPETYYQLSSSGGNKYLLKPYSIVTTSAGFAVLATAAWIGECTVDTPRYFMALVLVTAVFISAFYGALLDPVLKSMNTHLSGALMGILHLGIPLVLTISALIIQNQATKIVFTVLASSMLGFLAYVSITYFVGKYGLSINHVIAAIDLGFALALAVLSASLAVRFTLMVRNDK